MSESQEVVCPTCQGCGKVANSNDGEPWTVWEKLSPGADLAVRAGIIYAVTCPRCGGSGSAQGSGVRVGAGEDGCCIEEEEPGVLAVKEKTMSWSYYGNVLPKNAKEILEAQAVNFTGDGREEMEEAIPLIVSLAEKNAHLDGQISIAAAGSRYMATSGTICTQVNIAIGDPVRRDAPTSDYPPAAKTVPGYHPIGEKLYRRHGE